MLKKKITICNKLGLHARAAAKFVSHAGRYSSEVEIIKKTKTVNGKSIMGVMTLAASNGTELELIVEGKDEKKMMADLVALIEDKFGEEE